MYCVEWATFFYNNEGILFLREWSDAYERDIELKASLASLIKHSFVYSFTQGDFLPLPSVDALKSTQLQHLTVFKVFLNRLMMSTSEFTLMESHSDFSKYQTKSRGKY